MKTTKDNENPLVSVLVVNYNRAQLLNECLESLQKQSYSNLEIIVVDNGSTDLSLDVIRSFGSDTVRLIQMSSNTGFAAGCNAGIQVAEGSYVALLNNDAVASSEWIAELVKVARITPACAMWASKILFFGTDIIDKTGHLIYWDGQNRGRGTGEKDRGQYDQALEPLFPDGCAALYRKSVFLQAGGFDESFFAYADDADLGLRILWLGLKCRYVPNAVVYHHHSSTLGSFSSEKIFLVERNRFWLVIKNFPWFLVLVSPLFTAVRWVWNLIGAVLGRGPAGNFRKKASIISLVKALFRAYFDGIKGLNPVLSERRFVFKNRELSSLEFFARIWKSRISVRKLTLEDRKI